MYISFVIKYINILLGEDLLCVQSHCLVLELYLLIFVCSNTLNPQCFWARSHGSYTNTAFNESLKFILLGLKYLLFVSTQIWFWFCNKEMYVCSDLGKEQWLKTWFRHYKVTASEIMTGRIVLLWADYSSFNECT